MTRFNIQLKDSVELNFAINYSCGEIFVPKSSYRILDVAKAINQRKIEHYWSEASEKIHEDPLLLVKVIIQLV